MPSSVFRRFTLGSALLALLFGVPAARADLVWNPNTGWHVEGGLAAGLSGEQGRSALELMNKARRAEDNGNLKRAYKDYEKVAKKFPNSIYSPEALYRAAQIRLRRHELPKAFADYQELVTRYPNTPRFNDIIGEQYQIASRLLNGERGRMFWGLLPSFTNREASVGEYEAILIEAPYSDYAPLALLNLAAAHQKLHNPEEAIDALDRMINNYPQTLLAPDAYLKLAQAHASLVAGPWYDQAATRDAITYYEDFMILFPSDNNVAKAEQGLADMKETLAQSKIKIADFYFYRRDNYKAARVFYNEAITVYPDSKSAELARKRLADVDAAQARAAKEGPKKKHFLFF